jgi:hypothetical protein
MVKENEGYGWDIFENYKVIKANMPVERNVETWRCGDGCCSDSEWQEVESNSRIGDIISSNYDGSYFYDVDEKGESTWNRERPCRSCQWYVENGWIEPVFE